MADVVKLETVTVPSAPIDQDLIAGLEALLELARRGDIQGIAYVTIESVGAGQYSGCGTGWRGSGVDCNTHTVIGAIRILEHRLMFAKAMYD